MLSSSSYLRICFADLAMTSECRIELSHGALTKSRRFPRYLMLRPLSCMRVESYSEFVKTQSRFWMSSARDAVLEGIVPETYVSRLMACLVYALTLVLARVPDRFPPLSNSPSRD